MGHSIGGLAVRAFAFLTECGVLLPNKPAQAGALSVVGVLLIAMRRRVLCGQV